MATTEQKLKNKAMTESVLKNSAKDNNTVISQNNTPFTTNPTSSQQTGNLGGDFTGAGGVAGLNQVPNLMNKSTPSANGTKQVGESLVGTGAVAGMPDNYVNFMDVANAYEKQTNINNLRNGQPVSNNVDVPSVEEITGTTVLGTPAKSSKTTGVKSTVASGPVLKNADVNLSQYGDDSSAENYNNPNLVGGQNDKYTGANTKNSNIAYDPNATLEGLDPNYKFGWDAQLANSAEAGYIARRNDQIASALYNAGLTSLDDVANYLYKQQGFQNSNDAERRNTIASIYKRLGEIQGNNSSNGNQNENNGQGNNGVDNSASLNKMEQDLLQSKEGTLYGKNTADYRGDDGAIKTLQDQYNVEIAVNKQRVANLKSLQAIDSKDIATSIVSGTTPHGDQGMRDLMQYDPAKYQEVQNYIKEIKGQKNINSIVQNGTLDSDSSVTSTDIDGDIESWAKQNSTDGNYKEIVSSVKEELSSNETANTAQKEMNNISADIAKLQTRLKNIDREAKAAFKSDVPQYLVNAYKANKQLEIQDQISELESRYNTALNLYKTELSNTQWEKEFGLKQQQLSMQQQSQNFDQWYKTQTLQNSKIMKDSSGNNWQLKEGTDGRLYYEQIESISSYAGSGMKGAGLRNNNPGNIKDTGFGNVLGTDSRGFAMFATPEDGFDALVAKIENVQNGGSRTYSANMSLYDFFSKYAPSSDNNNPKAYAESVAKQLGTTANAPVSSVDATQFAAAIAKHDSGYDYSTYGQFRDGEGMGGDSSLNSLTWHGNIYDLYKYSGWDNLTDDEKITVQNLLTYQTDPASLPKTGDNGESNKKIRAAAGVIGRDFGYDERKFKQVDAVQKAWDKANGPSGVSSANSTAASILKTVADSFSDFNKYDIQAINSWINEFKMKIGDPTVGTMYTDLRVAASEIAKALKGNASATTEEINSIAALLDGKMSVGQARGVFQHFAKNLVEKNASEAMNYNRVVGYKPDSIYLPDVTQWMNDSLGINMSEYYNWENPNAIDLSGLQALANMLNF